MAASKPYACGVLFVHGIGEQRRGDALLQCADPLIRWLERWLARPGPQGRELGSLRLSMASTSEDDERGVPAHAAFEVVVNGCRGTGCAEVAAGRGALGWRSPHSALGRFALWLATVGAWIVLSHALRSARPKPGGGAANGAGMEGVAGSR